MRERARLRAIEEHLRREAPDLAAALDAFSAAAHRRDPVAHGAAVGFVAVIAVLLAGWAATGDVGLLTGCWLVAACSPVVWLVALARRPAPRR